jgi:small subunit ribosomal protein S6
VIVAIQPFCRAIGLPPDERRNPRERRTTHLMRRYELMLLLRPDLEDDKLQAAVEKVTRAIVNAGGSLSKVSPWGKRRLAYDIGRHREASYFLIHFDIEPAQVREIERGMLISEEILRHLVTVLEDRGPVDELAPAAAARTLDEDGQPIPADDEDDSGAGLVDGSSNEPRGPDADAEEITEPEPVAVAEAPDTTETEERAEG